MRILIVLSLLALASCAGAKESDRELNHQNIGAGKFIKTHPEAPPVVQAAGADVEANSLTLEKNVLGGPPKVQKDYSPEESKNKRDESDKDHATPWWKLVLGGIGTAALTWVTRGGLVRLLPALAGGVPGIALSILTEGIARVREKAAANGGNVALEGPDGLLATLAHTAKTNPAAHALIRDFAHKAEAKIAARL